MRHASASAAIKQLRPHAAAAATASLTTLLLVKIACAVVGDRGVLLLLGPLGPLMGLPPCASSIRLVTCRWIGRVSFSDASDECAALLSATRYQPAAHHPSRYQPAAH